MADITIEGLPSAPSGPARHQTLAVMMEGAAVRLTLAEVLSLILSGDIPADSVVTAKLADGAVTAAKMADGGVTATKIADGGVTLAKLADIASGRILGRTAGGSGSVSEIPLGTFGANLMASADAGAARSALGVQWEEVGSVAVSGSPAAVSFTGLAGTAEHRLVINGLRPATDDIGLMLQVQTGGASWATAGYAYFGRLQGAGAGVDLGSGIDAYDAGILLTRSGAANGIGNAAGEGFEGEYAFVPADAGQRRRVRGFGTYTRPDGSDVIALVGGVFGSSSAITGIRILCVSGVFANTGSVRLIRRLA